MTADTLTSEPYRSFQRHLRRGWSVIPIGPRSKKPALRWKPYQEKRASWGDVTSWIGQWANCGPGIVTGRISGIFVLDVDGEEGVRSLKGLGKLPQGAVALTAKGRHYYFRYPELAEGEHVITGS